MLKLRGSQLELAQVFLVALPSFVLFAYNQSGVGGLLSIPSWVETFPQIDTVFTHGSTKAHNTTIQGVVVGTCTLGALVGSLACSVIGDILGRRKTVAIAAALTFVGEVLCCTSFEIAQFIIGRFIIGLGVGVLSTTVPVWQAECSKARNRGRHVVLDGIFLCVGYALEAWINLAFFQFKRESVSWRLPLVIPALISLVLLTSVYAFPESPRWLSSKGKYQKARQNLSALRDLPDDALEISNEMAAIEWSLEESSKAARKRDLFTMGEDKVFYRFMLCIVLQFFQQWCGSNLISSYSTVIFQEGLGLSSEMARILSGACLTWKFCSSFIAFFTVDRFGRRKLFMVSGTGMSLCMLSLSITSSMPKSNRSAQIASVCFVFLFNTFVPIGFIGANYLYVTEVAPVRLRMPMTSFSTANHWLWNFAVLMITPIAMETIGYRYYILYTISAGCIPFLVYFFFPETMGRSLEQMDDLFRHNSVRHVVTASLQPVLPDLDEIRASAKAKEYAESNRIEDKEA